MKTRIRQKSFAGVSPFEYLGGNFSTLFFVIMASFILILSLIRPQALTGIRVGAMDMITPVLATLASPFQNMADAVDGVSSAAELRAENTKLKTENTRLKEWYQTALMLQAENQSLQELLNLKVDPEYNYVTARVVSDAGNAFIKTILISSGSNIGIAKNQAVLAGEGMIGRIIETGKNAARVLLMSDINSRIPIIIEGSRQKAIAAGTNGNHLSFKHLPSDSGLSLGARVVTSGDGGVFPSGLPVGRVEKSLEGNFIIKPFADIQKVTYVRVINAPMTLKFDTENLEIE